MDDTKSDKIKNMFSNKLCKLRGLENSEVLTLNDAPQKVLRSLSVVSKVFLIHTAQIASANFTA